MKINRLKKMMLGMGLTWGMLTVSAQPILHCPDVAHLSQYEFVAAFPTGYNQQHQSVKSIALAIDPSLEQAILVVKPLYTGLLGDPKSSLFNLIPSLNVITPNPINYQIDHDVNLPLCLYAVPNSKQSSMLFIIDDLDLEAQHAVVGTKAQQKHQRLQALMPLFKRLTF